MSENFLVWPLPMLDFYVYLFKAGVYLLGRKRRGDYEACFEGSRRCSESIV